MDDLHLFRGDSVTISGDVPAKCRSCGSIFEWSLDNWPGLDVEIIFTCDDCRDNKEHDCINEYIETEYGFAVIGHWKPKVAIPAQ